MELMAGQRAEAAFPARGKPWTAWQLVLPCLVPLIYLPTLAFRFDFADDGCLAYPVESARGVAGHLRCIWEDTVNEFRARGPFRPVCVAHWHAGANLLGPTALYRRLARLGWAVLAAGTLSWWLRELRVPPWPVLLTTALAFWNPYRAEIWMGLGLTEAFGMPYAMAALACATRAARSARPARWDLACMLCLVLALGIKNTFAAAIPAVVFLRLTAGGLPLREGLRRHGLAACLVGATLVLPVAHFVWFKLSAHPVGYEVRWTWLQVPRMVRGVVSAANLDYLAPALLLAAAAWRVGRQSAERPAPEPGPLVGPAAGAGACLLLFGVGVYLPIDGISGRYTMPAVWGADVLSALAFTGLLRARPTAWRTSALAALGCCLAVLLVSNFGKQWKWWARIDVCWQALEYVERDAPTGTAVRWIGTASTSPGTDLTLCEGFHFRWHLEKRRRRPDVSVDVVSLPDTPGAAALPPRVVLCGPPTAGAVAGWAVVKRFAAAYWAGTRRFECCLLERCEDATGTARPASRPHGN
jgi:hypothetical protein